MSQHLSSREVSQWMIGERTPQQEQHVCQCPECGAELARMEAALALFRGSVRHWSDGQAARAARHWAHLAGAAGTPYPADALGARRRGAVGAGGGPDLSKRAG